jgi:hypothetical protein
MPSINTRVATNNQITTDYDLSKIFVFENRYENDSYVNNSNYSPLTLLAGTVMGRVANTGAVVPFYASANDGSQFPIGVLAQDLIAIPGGSSKQCSLCVSGDVVQNKLIFFYADTLDTVVQGRRVRDRIGADSVGLKLVPSTEMTDYDN